MRLFLFFLLNLINLSVSFSPSKNVKLLTELLDSELERNEHFMNTGETFTHAEILRRGLIQSVVKYFFEKQELNNNNENIGQKFTGQKVQLDKLQVYYKNLNELYRDYLGTEEFKQIECSLELDAGINAISDYVSNVDFDLELKDLPYAHFDAETFQKSNEHISALIKLTFASVNRKDFPSARKFVGQALHAIHDFYSHSNWVEMGFASINEKIGRVVEAVESGDLGVKVADAEFNSCTNQTCTKQIIECSSDLKGLEKISVAFNLNLPIQCPIVYYKCFNNVLLSRLTSGFYSGQKLSDGSRIEKPANRSKCSHGGFLDKTALNSAVGGINKDTAYYFLSPHAHLHQRAASLAVQHTEHFFNFLRSQIGDENFDELLELMHAKTSRFYCLFKRIFS